MAGCAVTAFAQQVQPDAGRVLQETRPPELAPAPVTVPPIEAPAHPRPAVPEGGGDVRVLVTHFVFTGNAALSAEALQAAVAPWSGRALNFGELIEAVEAVEARYKEAGYFLAQGYLPPQKIRDGAIEIAISEGRLGEARLEGESRVSPDVIYGYLDRLPKDQALQLPMVERQVLLINELAGGQASLDLQAGEKPGTTDVVLAQKPEELITGRVEYNNQGAPSTGVKRLGLMLNAASPFALGERVSAMALSSDNGGLTSYNLRGELPIGGDGWRLIGTASRAEYSLGGKFASLNGSGTADSLRLGASYPIIRSRAANLKIQLEGDDSKLKDKLTGSDSNKRSHGLTATLSGDMNDEWMGGGSTRVDLALRSGWMDLNADALASPATSPGVSGHFGKATLTAMRLQSVTRDVGLQFQLTWQGASKNLDSSEKLGLGGATSLPGYASGEATGDGGFHAKIGARWQALPELALTAFTDMAELRLLRDPPPGTPTNRKRMSDFGISADWMLSKQFSANAILAWAGREAPSPTDNDRPRFWFSLAYAW